MPQHAADAEDWTNQLDDAWTCPHCGHQEHQPPATRSVWHYCTIVRRHVALQENT